MKISSISIIAAILLFTACNKADSDSNLATTGKSGSITRFTTYENYMYALDQNQLLVYDITEAENPKMVNRVAADYGLETIIIYDRTIYVGSRTALYILDIGNPASPFVLSKSDRGDLRGGCDPVVVKENYAFSTVKIVENVCGNIAVQSQLLVYDITNKSNPVLVNSVTMSMPNGLGYKGNYLFVCDEGTNAIEIFDITEPKNIQPYSNLPLTAPVDLIVDGEKMIVSTKTNFSIYNIANADDIKSLGQIPKY